MAHIPSTRLVVVWVVVHVVEGHKFHNCRELVLLHLANDCLDSVASVVVETVVAMVVIPFRDTSSLLANVQVDRKSCNLLLCIHPSNALVLHNVGIRIWLLLFPTAVPAVLVMVELRVSTESVSTCQIDTICTEVAYHCNLWMKAIHWKKPRTLLKDLACSRCASASSCCSHQSIVRDIAVVHDMYLRVVHYGLG